MSFKSGFEKISTSLSTGLTEAAKQTVGDVMKLKGLRESISDTRKAYKGKYKDLLNTGVGRAHLSHQIGKSLPSAVVGAGYASIGKKVIKKMNEDTPQEQNYYQ